jgi:hypothetical protein
VNQTGALILALLGLALAGCASPLHGSAPLGRSIAAGQPRPLPVSHAPAPTGDPPSERGGTIPPGARCAEDSVSRAGVDSTPQLALRRYALMYTNWRASELQTREHQLAAISIGTAKLTAEQEAAARSGGAALIPEHVANTGQVVAITPGEGPEAGHWVIVTLEHTTGIGAYAGLSAGLHVTVAEVRHLDRGWVVSAWNPVS